MKFFNGIPLKLTIIILITSGLCLASMETESSHMNSAVMNSPKVAQMGEDFNPTAYTRKPKATVSKSSVRDAQKLLKSQGFLKSNPDGIVGFETKQAVKAYQIEKKLDVTGVLDKETLNAMNVDWKKGHKTY